MQRARFDDPEADFGARDFFRTPNNTGVLNVTFRNARLGQAFIGLRYTGQMDVPRFFFDESGEEIGQALIESEDFLTVGRQSVAQFQRRERRLQAARSAWRAQPDGRVSE